MRKFFSIPSFFIFIAFFLFSHPVGSKGVPGPSLNSWQRSAFRYYRDDEYDKSRNILEKHRQDRFGKMLFTFVVHQQWVYSQSKAQKQVWVGEYKVLKASVGIEDIPYLAMIGQEVDKPKASKLAKGLLKNAFKNIFKTEDIPILIRYLEVQDPDINQYSMATLQRILKRRRKIVKDGGTLRSKDIKMMKNRRLLGQLGAVVSQQPAWGHEPNYPKGVSKAMQCLVLIEEPSLKVLEGLSGINVNKAKQKVQKAINSRRKKFPNSNWYSATGKNRS